MAGASSDSDGRFTFRLPLGLTSSYFSALPDGFEYPRPQIIKKLAVVESDEPIALEVRTETHVPLDSDVRGPRPCGLKAWRFDARICRG